MDQPKTVVAVVASALLIAAVLYYWSRTPPEYTADVIAHLGESRTRIESVGTELKCGNVDASHLYLEAEVAHNKCIDYFVAVLEIGVNDERRKKLTLYLDQAQKAREELQREHSSTKWPTKEQPENIGDMPTDLLDHLAETQDSQIQNLKNQLLSLKVRNWHEL